MRRVLLTLLLIICGVIHCKKYMRVCYYTNWAQYRPAEAKFRPDDIDPFLCTHVIYAFAKISDDGRLAPVEWNDFAMYRGVVALKKKNPQLKVMLAVGGWNHENGAISKFSKMVRNVNTRQIFIDSTVQYLRIHGFDGLDVNWEFPAGRGNSLPVDQQRFTFLMEELMIAFDKDSTDKRHRLLLSAAVSSNYKIVDSGYEVKKLGKVLDWINLMTYDLHGKWESVTGHHTAMAHDGVTYGSERETLTVPYGLNHWIMNGFPARKIALGLATYGRTFALNDPTKNGLGAPKAKWRQAKKGRYTRESGFLSYYEICAGKYTIMEDNIVSAPYGYSGHDWVSFDNPKSMRFKVITSIKDKELAGAMFWALSLDDFSGNFCNQGKYPLIKAVVDELNAETPPIPTKPTNETTTKTTTTKYSTKVATTTISTKVSPRTPVSSLPPTHTPTHKSTNSPELQCRGFGLHKNDNSKHGWCKLNCERNHCPKSHCRCKDHDKVVCFTVMTWRNAATRERYNDWCETNCAMGFCPGTLCKCQNSN